MKNTQAAEFTQLPGLAVILNKDGTCTTEMELRKHHLSVAARARGCVLASMLDETLGSPVFGEIPEGNECSTMSFTISFPRPGIEGGLICTARVGNMTCQKAYDSGEIHDDEGRIIAPATRPSFLTPTVKQCPKNFAP
jgi:uncharacterized protein (TIGR00369 family)